MKDDTDSRSIAQYLEEINCAEHWTDIQPILSKSGVLLHIRRNVLLASVASNKPSTELADYSVEVVADIMSSLILSILGSYKSSMMTLRSAIENCIRILLLDSGSVVWNAFDIREMFKCAKSDAEQIDKRAAELVLEARDHYKTLCAFVHTGGTEQMTLEGRLRQIPRFDEERLRKCLAEIQFASKFATNILFLVHSVRVRAIHPESRDLVLDGVSKRLKAKR